MRQDYPIIPVGKVASTKDGSNDTRMFVKEEWNNDEKEKKEIIMPVVQLIHFP